MQKLAYCVWIICVLHLPLYIYEFNATKLNMEDSPPADGFVAIPHAITLTDVTEVTVLSAKLFGSMKIDAADVENVTSRKSVHARC